MMASSPEMPGSRSMPSYTAFWKRCLHPRYCSLVSIETCPGRNWICSSWPPACWQSRAHVLRRPCGARHTRPAGWWLPPYDGPNHLRGSSSYISTEDRPQPPSLTFIEHPPEKQDGLGSRNSPVLHLVPELPGPIALECRG